MILTSWQCWPVNGLQSQIAKTHFGKAFLQNFELCWPNLASKLEKKGNKKSQNKQFGKTSVRVSKNAEIYDYFNQLKKLQSNVPKRSWQQKSGCTVSVFTNDKVGLVPPFLCKHFFYFSYQHIILRF